MDDPAAIDAELARLQAFIDRSPVDADGFLDGEMRAAQKQASRDRDELLVASGRMTRAEVGRKNGMLAGVDISKLRIVSVGGVPYEDLG